MRRGSGARHARCATGSVICGSAGTPRKYLEVDPQRRRRRARWLIDAAGINIHAARGLGSSAEEGVASVQRACAYERA